MNIYIYIHTYCCIHYSSAMGADGVGNMANVDGGKKLGFGGPLHKYLVVEIIAVVGDKDVDIPHDLEHVQTLTVATTHNMAGRATHRLLTCSSVWLGSCGSTITKPYFCSARFLMSP